MNNANNSLIKIDISKTNRTRLLAGTHTWEHILRLEGHDVVHAIKADGEVLTGVRGKDGVVRDVSQYVPSGRIYKRERRMLTTDNTARDRNGFERNTGRGHKSIRGRPAINSATKTHPQIRRRLPSDAECERIMRDARRDKSIEGRLEAVGYKYALDAWALMMSKKNSDEARQERKNTK